MSDRLTGAQFVELLADPGSFSAWDTDVVSTDPLSFSDTMPYPQRLQRAAERSGASEAITAGAARLDGHDVVLIVGEFGFLGGTLGAATAQRVIRAFDRAATKRVPVIALPVSGGTRMQEGTAGFIRMAGCAAAVQRFRDAGLLYVSYLRNPTTGGVLASWASRAHIRLAEPGALIGLTGPRVVQQLTGEAFPEGVQVAENLVTHGVVDAVVAPASLRQRLSQILACSNRTPQPWHAPVPARGLAADVSVDAWTAVTESRRPDRFDVLEVLRACGGEGIALRGDGAGHDDANCRVMLARVCDIAAVVLLQVRDRHQGTGRGAAIGAVGYRQYRRGIGLAGELGLPVVSFVDTQGAAMTAPDEEAGLAAMIGECLSALSAVPTPTLAVLLGEGAGGGAIALLPADRVIAAEHSWLSPIAPEGASAILYRTTQRAPEVAAAQAIAATDLRRLGIVDVVVPDAGDDPVNAVAAVIGEELHALVARGRDERLAARTARYRDFRPR